ncbi:NfeD family protein [Commensalibacter oyaizuii]|uniref:NfeD family protein n=1 Tax=Commensalibacter oyaizuii TaxID=3043873 RepID=A0ABT6Q036_9PROT|nr:NfeD family protein [Commensalibacter sp. TBRC 16381]MDI2090481.1 NfeD family protein [Commensalibacter sp. TBRC 16381]
MNIESLWWIWVVIGVAFLLIELCTTTFFASWMALAAIVPTILSFVYPNLSIELQILFWVVAVIICSGLWVWFSKRDTPHHSFDNEIVGQIGILATACDDQQNGVILLQKPIQGMSQWSCISNSYIPADTRVIVTEKINPTLLRVDFQKKQTI